MTKKLTPKNIFKRLKQLECVVPNTIEHRENTVLVVKDNETPIRLNDTGVKLAEILLIANGYEVIWYNDEKFSYRERKDNNAKTN